MKKSILIVSVLILCCGGVWWITHHKKNDGPPPLPPVQKRTPLNEGASLSANEKADIEKILHFLDGEEINKDFDWPNWQLKLWDYSGSVLIKDGVLDEDRVRYFVSLLGKSSRGDICWAYAIPYGLLPSDQPELLFFSPSDFKNTDPRPEWVATVLRENKVGNFFSEVVVDKFLSDAAFRKRYVQILLCQGPYMPPSKYSGLAYEGKIRKFTYWPSGKLKTNSPYFYFYLREFLVMLYMTSETEMIDSLSPQNAETILKIWLWKVKNKDLLDCLVVTKDKTRWRVGSTPREEPASQIVEKLPNIHIPDSPFKDISYFPSRAKFEDGSFRLPKVWWEYRVGKNTVQPETRGNRGRSLCLPKSPSGSEFEKSLLAGCCSRLSNEPKEAPRGRNVLSRGREPPVRGPFFSSPEGATEGLREKLAKG